MTQMETLPARATRVDRIEERIDKQASGAIAVSTPMGGLRFGNMMEVMEFSKLMAVADIGIPKHLRGNVGACLAVCIQAIEWKMSPFAVANKSYIVNDRVAYESQLIHAIVEQRAPLAGRLRCRYTGEGEDRRCIVYASVKGEAEPFEYQSAPFKSIQPKNSPLWKTKPDLQLFYNASRDWARMYFPDVIMGIYAEDEIEPTPEPSPQTELQKRLAQAESEATPIRPATDGNSAPSPDVVGTPGPVGEAGPQHNEDAHDPPQDDANQAALPAIPETHEQLVDAVARRCGISMTDAATKLKLVLPKPWVRHRDRAEWWERFNAGAVEGLKPVE